VLFERVIGTFKPQEPEAKLIWEPRSYQYDDLQGVLELERRNMDNMDICQP
jgi:hypothetical protein